MPDRFQVHAQTDDGGDPHFSCSSDDIYMTPDSDGRVLLQLDTNSIPTCAPDSARLTAYRNYTATIVAKNNVGNSTGVILISKPVCIAVSRSCKNVCLAYIFVYHSKG